MHLPAVASMPGILNFEFDAYKQFQDPKFCSYQPLLACQEF